MLVAPRPTAIAVAAAPSIVAAAPKAPAAQPLTVGQFNAENFFEAGNADGATRPGEKAPTEAEYATKLAKLAHTIQDDLHSPDILTLEEIGSDVALNDLVTKTDLAKEGYKALRLPTNDRRSINVALIYKADRLHLDASKELTPDLPGGLKQNHGQIDPGKLFARPPLVADFTVTGANQAAAGAQQLEFVVNHWAAKIGGPPAEASRVASAAFLGGFVDAQRAANPTRPIFVLGDLNSATEDEPIKNIKQGADGITRLYDAPDKVTAGDRYTYIFKGHKDMLDHVLVTPDLKGAITSVEIPHNNTGDPWIPSEHRTEHENDPKVSAGTSDHDPILVNLDLSKIAASKAPKG